MRPVIVGIITPSSASTAALRGHLLETGLATVAVEVAEYCRSRSDWNTRRFLEVRPDVILIDAEDFDTALISVQVLHTAIPSAWILVCTRDADAATILKVVRAGAREVVPVPLAPEALSEALQRHIQERERADSNDTNANGKIFTISSAKRGSGSTTTAINLAASLSENKSARVALIELDWPIGDVAAFLNIKPRFTIADALASVARMDSVLLESYMHKHDNFHVLSGLETFVDGDPFDAAAVSQLLEVATQTYTHVVVDLPPSLSKTLFYAVCGMSSTILAVVTPDLPALRRTERLLRLFDSMGVLDRVRLVLNRSNKSNEISDSDIEKVLRQRVVLKVANDYQACREAINAGKTIIATSSKNVAKNYRDLAGQLMGQPQKKGKGLLGLLPRTSLSFS